MCFHRPWLFSWFMRSVVGVVVGFLADSPAFSHTFFTSPPYFFLPMRNHLKAGKYPQKRNQDAFCCWWWGRFELEKAAVLFWVFLFIQKGSRRNYLAPAERKSKRKELHLFLKDSRS